MSHSTGAWGVGLATLTDDGRVLDTWYPSPALTTRPPALRADDGGPEAPAEPGTRLFTPSQAAELLSANVAGTAQPGEVDRPSVDVAGALGRDERRGVERVAVLTYVPGLDDPPLDAHDAYLRLHLLSHRLVEPHGTNLDGIFGLLTSVVWTTLGPCPVEGFENLRLRLQASGLAVQVFGVDKFPRMVDYVIPSGVRIGDADRVRLGAHLASGTTVMHEGFVNFNAGTLGTSMVEGRISAGVVLDDGSDLGGGASIMGTLSGGGKEVVRVGKRCLVGANAGIGISLGDDCVVEAGLYVTAGSRVRLPDGQIVKAADLSGTDSLLYRRNSITGAMEALPRAGRAAIALNPDLHTHN